MKPFVSINGQRHIIDQIDKHTPQSRFEEEVVGFIQDWQSGQEDFHQNTSGSTGKPKLIEIQRSHMMASAMMTIKALHLLSHHNSLLCLSPEYIAGKMMIVRSLINKMNIIAVEPVLNPVNRLKDHIHFAALIPTQLHHILENPTSASIVNTFDNIILGGGAIPLALEKKVVQLKPNIYGTYGMTETVSHIALKKLNGIDRSNYYTCFDEIELNQDVRDCLTIQGHITNDKTIITNDRVQLINDRQFEWLGRIDNVINSGGIKIQSEKVENKIEKLFSELQLSNRFFIAGLPHESLGQQVTLFIEGKVSISIKKIIKTQLTDRLAKYEIPKDILYSSKFVQTPTGKVNRLATTQAFI